MEQENIISVSKDPDMFINYFDDLSKKQESSLLSNKIQALRNDISALEFKTTSYNTKQLDTTPDQKVGSSADAILNQQFFVWKNGVAGRLSVDTPFGYEAL